MPVVHRARSGAALAHRLAAVPDEPLADPLASEVVAVPAKGVQRWLAHRLSHVLGAGKGDGVCANVVFPWPSTLLDDAVQAAAAEHDEAIDRWAPQQLIWPPIATRHPDDRRTSKLHLLKGYGASFDAQPRSCAWSHREDPERIVAATT